MLPEKESNNSLIAKNATMLYIRMFVSMAISFYTSRIVLQALGVSDYGIYNLVGGIVVLVNILSSALSGATSRFLTYTLGEHDEEKLTHTFSTALIIHCGLALLFFIVAETIGLWFVNTHLVIVAERMKAANWVYQSAVISTVLSITQVPYNSLITSHEHFGVFAVIEILNSCLKLGIAFIVLYSITDHLVLYSILYTIVAIAIMLYYRYYCIMHFPESHFRRILDRSILPGMLKFSGWNLFGNASLTVSQQGGNILLNWFFGTIINAASGVALQVQAILYAFIGNISTAFRPQVIKAYAVKNYERVNYLIDFGAKLSSFFTLIISIPVILKMDFLINLWLEKVPEGTIIICQLLLVMNFFNSFNPLPYTAITATGKVNTVNIICGIINLLQIPLIYIVLRLTHSYVYIYILNICLPMSTGIGYLVILKLYMKEFQLQHFIMKNIFLMTLVGLIALAICYYLNGFLANQWIATCTILLISTILVSSMVYWGVIDTKMRKNINKVIKNRIVRG